jgi:serine/threonine protein kinase/Tfp pilus assembly protein PilF
MEQIGEGGFGVVFLAEQYQPVRRKVAFKILKPGMDSRQVVARFEAERQALALMDHPNIARVLDGGAADSGRPFFVMDLVKGVSITNYCDEHRLTLRERLALLLPVCQAVQHAHQKGIIHRDLKPSNVLVADSDSGGPGVPKVIDFGVAKALGQQLSEQTLTTSLGGIIGTLEYMSPEQADFGSRDIDTRADIYSLGVLMYELLTGTTPLTRKRLSQEPVTELLRIIREEEAEKPSSRVMSAEDSLTSVAAKRNRNPARLTHELKGELDWIVLKALEKDRDRRYVTTNALARDIERFLNDEPVEACPPSAVYRIRKFARKNRKWLGVAAAFALLLTAGTVVSLWQAVRATRAEFVSNRERERAEANEKQANEERRRAEEKAQIARAVRNFLENKLLLQADPVHQAKALLVAGGSSAEVKSNPTIRELLDRAAREVTPDKIEAQFPNQPVVQADILQTIGLAYDGIGAYGPAIAHLERARDLLESALGPDDLDSLRSVNNLALSYQSIGKLPEAIRLFEQTRERQIKNLGPDHKETLVTLMNLAVAYKDFSRTAEAIPLLEQVRDKQIEKLGPDHPDTFNAVNNLAVAYHTAGNLPEAIRLYEQLRDKRIEKQGPEHPETLITLLNLAIAYRDARKLSDPIRVFKELADKQAQKLGADNPHTLIAKDNLARAYQDAGKLAEAIPLFEEVLSKRLELLGPDHPNTRLTRDSLSHAYVDAGRVPDAIRLFEQMREKLTEKLGPDDPLTLAAQNNLAFLYWVAKQLDRSVPLFEQVLKKMRAKLGADHPETLRTQSNLAVNYLDAGRPTEAVPLFEDALGRVRKLPVPNPGEVARVSGLLAWAYDQAGELAKAEPLHRESLEQARRHLGADHSETARALVLLGLNLLRQNKSADAEVALRECLAIHEKKEPDAWLTFNAKSVLGGALLAQKKYADAEPLLLQGYEGMKQREASIPPLRKARLAEALERLVQFYQATGQKDQAEKWRQKLAEQKKKDGSK